MADDEAGCRIPIQLAAMFTAGAGAVHLAAAVPHFTDSVLLGSGFVAAGWAQLAAAALLLRRGRDRSVRWSAVALNVVVAVTWVVSRTVGLPLGHPGPEAVGLADVLTVGLEIAAVGVLVWRARREPVGRWRRIVVLASTWTFVIGGSTLAIADVGTHGHQGTGDEGHEVRESAEERDHASEPHASTSSPTASATRAMADDIAPRSWPGAGGEASSSDPDPDHGDTDEHDAAYTHAPGERH